LFERVEQSTQVPMLVLSIAFLGILITRQVGNLPHDLSVTLEAVEWIIWGAFAVELTFKTYLAPKRLRYLLHHWMDVIIVVFPFLRPVQALRVIAVTARSWTSMRRVLVHQTAGVIGLAAIFLVFSSALLVYGFEQTGDGPITSFEDALWWSVVTITTVGYGDTYPTTDIGRGVAVFLMVSGITLFGMLTARVAAFFVEEEDASARAEEQAKLDQILNRLERIEAQNREMRARLAAVDTSRYDD
jgi:voltage-gated potassium channel